MRVAPVGATFRACQCCLACMSFTLRDHGAAMEGNRGCRLSSNLLDKRLPIVIGSSCRRLRVAVFVSPSSCRSIGVQEAAITFLFRRPLDHAAAALASCCNKASRSGAEDAPCQPLHRGVSVDPEYVPALWVNARKKKATDVLNKHCLYSLWVSFARHGCAKTAAPKPRGVRTT